MRIEYKGTLLEQILKLTKTRPIDFVHLNPEEFEDVIDEAEEKGILKNVADVWFSIKVCGIVFYLDDEA